MKNPAALAAIIFSVAIIGVGTILQGTGALRMGRLLPANAAPSSLPQDPAAQQKRMQDTLDWNRRTYVGAYDVAGKKDPRWDDAACRALEKAAQFYSRFPEPRIDIGFVHNETQEAVRAGCDDPLIHYLHSRTFPETEQFATERLKSATAAAEGMKTSAYPAFRRACAINYLASQHVTMSRTPPQRGAALLELDAVLALLPISAAEDDRAGKIPDVWLELSESLVYDYKRLGFAPEQALARVEKGLSASPTLAVTQSIVRGKFYAHYGWEARGTGAGNTVSADAWAKCRARLALARAALESAWAAEPGNRHAATQLMNLELDHGGDRASMETWFARAMEADTDNRDACWTKMEWLHPKWHGSKEEMMAFARACRDTKNVRSGIPLLLAEAHHYIADMSGDGNAKLAYLRKDEVWQDILDVYRVHLEYHPNDHHARTYFAYLALVCSRPTVAMDQFDLVGRNLTASRRFTVEKIRQMRDDAFKRAGGRPVIGVPAPKAG